VRIYAFAAPFQPHVMMFVSKPGRAYDTSVELKGVPGIAWHICDTMNTSINPSVI
jgi:hypothetical protein